MIVINLPYEYDHDERQILFVLLRYGKRTLGNILLELSHRWMVKYEHPNRHIAGFTVCCLYLVNSPWERGGGKSWGREAGMVVRVTRRCHLQKKLCTMLQCKYFQPNTISINPIICVISLQPFTQIHILTGECEGE